MSGSEKHYLQKLLDFFKMNPASFAKSIGHNSPNKIYYILRFRNGVSPDVASDICNKYDNVNYNWLLKGEGEMLKNVNDQKIGDLSNATAIGNNVNGNGNQITHNDISGMIELQKGYQDMIKKRDEQIDKLLIILDKFSNK